jgi:hypothetical protein
MDESQTPETRAPRWLAAPVWLRVAVPIGLAGVLVLFPFDWLADVWPAYAAVFDQVFSTARSHAIGHATIFGTAGLLVLIALPALRPRPARYLALMVLGAIAEELLQDLFKLQMPTIWDGRDLLYDLCGYVIAYLAVRLWLALGAPALPGRSG